MTVSQTTRTQAIFYHDVFNIVFMTLVSVTSISLLSFTDHKVEDGRLFGIISMSHVLKDLHFVNSCYSFLLNFIFSYMIIDTLWIVFIPHCVAAKSPTVVIVHHIVSFGLFIVIKMADHKHQWYSPALFILESNTVLLASRRQLSKTNFTSLHYIADKLFYVSWYFCRCLWLPFIIYVLYLDWMELPTIINRQFFGIIFLGLLAILSFQWTYEMIMKNLMSKEV